MPQLIDQVEFGVVDIIWALPGFSSGRFPLTEVFELPFMIRNAEAASRALWDYVHQYDMREFAGMRPLALHVHGGGVFHTIDRPIKSRSDLRGMKMRAPTRQTTRFMAILGATPVGMPVPQVPEALAKGFHTVNYCLIRTGNPSGEMDRGLGHIFRRYVLYEATP